jgi:hypothetical protein
MEPTTTVPSIGKGLVWCNQCASGCATEGCYDTCGLSDLGRFFGFVGLLILCGGGTVGLILLAICFKNTGLSSNHNVTGRMWTAFGLVVGGIPQVCTQYFGVFHRGTGNIGKEVPPCIGSSSSIGLWTSGYNGVDTGDFLSICTGSNGLGLIQGMRVTSMLALFGSVAGCFCLFALPSGIPGFALVGFHFFFLIVTAVLAETLWATDDFCHSGRTLEGLLYTKGSAIESIYAAMFFTAVGVTVSAIIRCCRPDCFEPVPEPQVQQQGAVEGQPVQGQVVSMQVVGAQQPQQQQQQGYDGNPNAGGYSTYPQPQQQQDYGHDPAAYDNFNGGGGPQPPQPAAPKAEATAA